MRSTSLSLLLCLSLLAAGARRVECRQAGQQPEAAAQAQTAPAPVEPKPDKQAEKIKRLVKRVRIGGRITVKTKDGGAFHGAVRSIAESSFDILEVDRQQVMTFRYDEVKKARSNYTPKNIFGQRPDPKKSAIIFGAAMVGLFTLIILSIPKT